MNQETHYTYQAMFLLDNQEVRKGFNAARDWLKNVLEKHGIQVRVLRLWGERRLAYPIRQRRRATFVLGWLEGPAEAVAEVKRDLYLVGPVFRVLFLREQEIPEDELAFGIQEVDEATLHIPEDSSETEDQGEYSEDSQADSSGKDDSGDEDSQDDEEEEAEAVVARRPARETKASSASGREE